MLRLAVCVLGLLAAALAEAAPEPVKIEWDTNRSTVRVVGEISRDLLLLDNPGLQQVFPVTVEPREILKAIGLPPIVGTYSARSNYIQFEPLFPFEPGVQYRATFHPAKTSSVLSLARPVFDPTTVVSQVYPSADLLPQNLLKFYIQFSAPMSGGHIYEHIHLAGEDGKNVELPFLEIDEELWSPDMTRLTLFLDPGRIKRGVRPLEEAGPALLPGQSYTLLIATEWNDARGVRLKKGFEKKFRVTEPDRDPPDPATWRIAAPESGTRQPLTVTFVDPMDHALALRMLWVKDVTGHKSLEANERRWIFVPDEPWRKGPHEIAVLTTIEDLAGNNIGKPFEVDLQDARTPRELGKTIILRFEASSR